MALIKCPECNQDVSSSAVTCPHCAYPVKEYVQQKAHEAEVKRLTDKILPCEFTVPEPRAKVCIKCTEPFSSVLGNYGQPRCNCGFPGVEVDYQQAYSGNGHLPTYAYILENCVIPRNIGDSESEEYKVYVDGVYRRLEQCGKADERTPPNPKYFGKDLRKKELQDTDQKENQKQIVMRLKKNIEQEKGTKKKFLIAAIVFSLLAVICLFSKPLFVFGILFAGVTIVVWYLIYSCRGSVARMESELQVAEKDIATYEETLKHRAIAAQASLRQAKAVKEVAHPQCPMCNGNNTRRISTFNRGASIAAVGLASSKIGKQFECLDCKYKW